MALLGIDVGSSALKATIIDEQTGLYILRSVEYAEDWAGERPDHLERRPETYWEAFQQAVHDLFDKEGVAPERIQAISFSVQGETFVILDEHFRPLRKAIQGHDIRAREEAILLRIQFGEERLYAISGQPSVDAYWIAAKLLWVKRNQPEIFSRIRHFLTLEGYLIHRLTGRAVAERSMIGNSYLYDMASGEWFTPMFDFLGLPASVMPELVQPGHAVGTVSREAALETGLLPKTSVIAGALDQVAAALGAGNVRPGVVTETTGTALALGITGTASLAQYLNTGLPIYYHVLADALFLMPWLGSGGFTLQWFRDNFAESDRHFAAHHGLDIYELLTAEAERIPPGSDGLIMLPFLSGANCPEFDTSARGVFFGIAPGHGRAHFVRAILEAIGYAIRANLELIRATSADAIELRSMGNAARSRVWTQIKADICGVPIRPMQVADAASLGAALLAGLGDGTYKSVEQAGSSRFIQTGEMVEPNRRNTKVYDEGFRKYREVYSRLKGCF